MPGDQQAFQKAMDLGHSAAWDQQWDRAATYYRQALDELPDQPTALTSLGLALFELQDLNGALRVYQRAAISSPTDPVPFEKVARILERMNRPAESAQAAMQAADLYLKGRDVDKAIENYSRVLSMKENLIARTRLALVYEKMGRKADAVSEYIAAASILQRSGDLVKAMQVAEYALHIMPDSLDAQQALTMLRTNQALNNPQRPRGGTGPIENRDVRQLAAPPEETSPDPIAEARQKAMVQLAALLFDQAEESPPAGQVSRRGINSLTRGTGGLSAQTAERARILLHLGQAVDSQTQGSEAQAAQELERAVEIGLKNAAAFFDLGLLYSSRDPQRALRYLQQSVKHPDFVLASFLLIGKVNQRDGSLKDASIAFLQALRLADSETLPAEQAEDLHQLYEPFIEAQTREENPKTLNAACESIANQLIRPDWRKYLRMARQQLPPQSEGAPPFPLAEILLETKNSQVLEMLAHVRQLSNQNRVVAAMEEAYFALQQAPTYLPLHVQIGDLLLKEGRVQDAVTKFMLISELYNLRGESAQAIRLLRRIIQIAPMDLTVRTRLIDLLAAQGQTEQAIQEYMNLAEIYYQLAELDMARQTYSAAYRLTQQARLSRKMAGQILYRMADIDLQRLDYRNALRVYELIRNLDTDDVTARHQLVDLAFRMGQDTTAISEVDSFVILLENSNRRSESIQFLIQILEQHPEKIEVRKRLADVYQRNNQVPLAVEQLDKVADVLLASGNRAAAIAIVQSIIAMKPANIQEYMRVIEQLRH
jgi:tetratricopeptide (TPR) repeat protein